MKTRFSSTEPPAPTGFINATFAEVVEDGVRKVAVWVPPSGGATRWWARAVLSGYQEPAEDVLVNRYRLILELDQAVTLLKCGTTAKEGPVGADFVADVLRSNDDGATWESIFASGSPADSDLAFIAAGAFKGDQFTFAIATLYPDDLLRIDVLVNEDAVGIEIVLEGTVDTVTSPIDTSPA